MTQEAWIKWGKGAAIAAGGAILTYIEMQVFPSLSKEFPMWAPVLTAINSALIQGARKFLESLSQGAAQ